jgi:hypothetical protein
MDCHLARFCSQDFGIFELLQSVNHNAYPFGKANLLVPLFDKSAFAGNLLMPELILDAFMAQIMNSSRLTAGDVAELRGTVFADGVMTRGEAQLLLDLDKACSNRCMEWTMFLNEAVSDYIVHQERPSGYVSQDNAVWLRNTLEACGPRTAVGILIYVLEKAKSAPEALSAFGLKTIAEQVLATDADKPRISADDVSMLRRILYASGGEGGIGLTRQEVEVLFDLNDQTSESLNDPQWHELFTKAVASFILCVSGHEAPSREEALRQERSLNDPSINLKGFFARMISGGVSAIASAYGQDRTLENAFAERNAEFEANSELAAVVDEDEARWLAARIGRDGNLHDNEVTLLKFLKAESTKIHPALEPLLERVA